MDEVDKLISRQSGIAVVDVPFNVAAVLLLFITNITNTTTTAVTIIQQLSVHDINLNMIRV